MHPHLFFPLFFFSLCDIENVGLALSSGITLPPTGTHSHPLVLLMPATLSLLSCFSFSRIFALASLYWKCFYELPVHETPGTKWKSNLTGHKAGSPQTLLLAAPFGPHCRVQYSALQLMIQFCQHAHLSTNLVICGVFHLKWKIEFFLKKTQIFFS